MKKLIAAIILFASSAVYAEEAKPTAQGETKAESPAPVEKPLDNKALIEMVEKIAAVKLDKKKTDVEKDAAISAIGIVGKKFEIKCELVESKKSGDDKYDVIFEDRNKTKAKCKTITSRGSDGKPDYSTTEHDKHLIYIRTSNGDSQLAITSKGKKVVVCGTITKLPSVTGHADYKDDIKAVEVFLIEKDLTIKQ